MEIAVFSDSHDNIWRMRSALAKAASADAFIHCGDLCAPFMVKQLGEAASGRPVHVVWGNNDGDVRLLEKIASQFDAFHVHGLFGEFRLGNLNIAAIHYPAIARPLAASGLYDLVCHGHDHIAARTKVGNCVLLNPGEVMGMHGKPTFAFFDSITREVRWTEVE